VRGDDRLGSALAISQGDPMIFVTHPISAGLLALAVAVIVVPGLWRRFGPDRRAP